VWDDEIDRSVEPWHYCTSAFKDVSIWGHRTGNMIRRRDVAFALERCNGVVALIWIRAADRISEPRKIVERRFMFERIGRIDADSFNPMTGEFSMRLHPA